MIQRQESVRGEENMTEYLQEQSTRARRASRDAGRRRNSGSGVTTGMAKDIADAIASQNGSTPSVTPSPPRVDKDMENWRDQAQKKRRRGSEDFGYVAKEMDLNGRHVKLDTGWARRAIEHRRSSLGAHPPGYHEKKYPHSPPHNHDDDRKVKNQDNPQSDGEALANPFPVAKAEPKPPDQRRRSSAAGIIESARRRLSFSNAPEDGSAPEDGVSRRRRSSTSDFLHSMITEESSSLEGMGFTPVHRVVTHITRRVRDSKWFQTSIIMVIFLAGIVVGIQTYRITDAATLRALAFLDVMILDIFIFESLLKLVAEGKTPKKFFNDAWNSFDFIIVVVSLLPFGSGAVTALRLVRLLRVLKLVRALPKLRILVMGLLKSMSSIAYIGLLLLMLFYLYAVMAVAVFGANDPHNLGTLHAALLTLFRCSTLEDWTDIMYINMYGCAHYGYDNYPEECVDSKAQGILSAAYFVTFVILSAMMILNLFIGVITSSMQDAKNELTNELEQEAAKGQGTDAQSFMEQRLDELTEMLVLITEEVEYYACRYKERRISQLLEQSRASKLMGDTKKSEELLEQVSMRRRTYSSESAAEKSTKLRTGSSNFSGAVGGDAASSSTKLRTGSSNFSGGSGGGGTPQ